MDLGDFLDQGQAEAGAADAAAIAKIEAEKPVEDILPQADAQVVPLLLRVEGVIEQQLQKPQDRGQGGTFHG